MTEEQATYQTEQKQTPCPFSSGNIDKLAEALAKAQGAMEPAIKSSDNPFFKSRYADLYSTWQACREPLTSNGLSITQLPDDSSDGYVGIVTILMHTSGQWIKSKISTKLVKPDPQALGSAISYLRRYALQAIVGISTADDDSESAMGAHRQDNGGNGSDKKSTKPDKKVEKTKTFADIMATIKSLVGEEAYYDCLGVHGYEHAPEITDRDIQTVIYTELRDFAKQKQSSSPPAG